MYALDTSKVTRSKLQKDAIGLCYTSKCETTGQYELTILARPSGPFDLKMFHDAIQKVPTLSHENYRSVNGTNFDGHGQVSGISTLLREEEDGLASLATKDVKKIILISSCFSESRASFERSLIDAASNFILVEFVEIELRHGDEAIHNPMTTDNLLVSQHNFAEQVSDFENCTLRRIPFDPWILMRVVEEWRHDLIFSDNGSANAVLSFPVPLIGVKRDVFCSLQPAIWGIADVFTPCKVCECHGQPLRSRVSPLSPSHSECCAVTGESIDSQNISDNSVTIGSCTVLTLPSSKESLLPNKREFRREDRTVFTVVRCISLGTLCEGLLFGVPLIMYPSFGIDEEMGAASDGDIDENEQMFASLLEDLHSDDKGLLCTSTVDVERCEETAFLCLYILLPAEHGTFLARRIAGAEECAVSPESTTCLGDLQVPDRVKRQVSQALAKVGTEFYNPLRYPRGCQTRLNGVVKESLHRLAISKPGKDHVSVDGTDRATQTKDDLEQDSGVSASNIDTRIDRAGHKRVDGFDEPLDKTGGEQSSLPPFNLRGPCISSENKVTSDLSQSRAQPHWSSAATRLKGTVASASFGKSLRKIAKLNEVKAPRQGLRYPPLPKTLVTSFGDPYAFPLSDTPGIKKPLPLPLPSEKYPSFKTASQVLQDS